MFCHFICQFAVTIGRLRNPRIAVNAAVVVTDCSGVTLGVVTHSSFVSLGVVTHSSGVSLGVVIQCSGVRLGRLEHS